MKEAKKIAYDYLREMYGNETIMINPNDISYGVEYALGYTICKLDRITKVNNMGDIIRAIGSMN
jgi:hypothetical protein